MVLGAQSFWTLDAVCHGILDDLVRQGRFAGDVIASIPIDRAGDLFLASRAYFIGDVVTDFTKIGGIRPVRDADRAEAFLRPYRGSKLSKIRTSSGNEKAHLTRYRLHAARTIFWLAEGDGARVAALFGNAGALGARRMEGYGRIASIRWEPSEESPLLDRNNAVRRPIPAEMAGMFGVEPCSPQGVDTWMPPYWERERQAVCFLPT
ncbi:hypothetical protein LAZ40_00885 [Cereibacter sphaeroides]|uniref:hypothetical protein n=1 Tax=Cereibacter sphaeroides TaxID=1063 RepID=UPI001F3E487A|nr:hypothetical protein [Cereibacter sphaeroides]MCE6957625.1 hypothetical protein [Cereibacter sphaeroides]MCE6971283.1 hypothetical protein [Cereibacter sphaeroides]